MKTAPKKGVLRTGGVSRSPEGTSQSFWLRGFIIFVLILSWQNELTIDERDKLLRNSFLNYCLFVT
jgi:hypothetical protein